MSTLVFFLSLFGTFVFIGKLLTWHAYKISPQNFEKRFSNTEILIANLVGIVSLLGWTFLFYLFTK